jgi:anaerobic selenocysteine-containing dehydrogenase
MEQSTVTARALSRVRTITGAIAARMPWGRTSPGLTEAAARPAPPSKIVPSACRLCYGRCGILGTVRDGRVVKIEGNPDIPSNVGTLCSRAYAIPQLMYSPYRLQYPLKRVGARGEGKWQRITWDEAMDTIAARTKEIIEKYGGHTIIHQYGTGRDMYQFNAINRLFLELGSTATFGVGNLCWLGSYLVSRRIYGDETQYTGWDATNSKLIIHWARQERSRGYYDWLQVKDAKKRGAKYIVVDSRFTSGASKADLWLPVRPGSDMALVLAFINTLISENLYDRDFVTRWTNGPFLVKPDGWLLTQRDLDPNGSPAQYIVWDEATERPMAWDAQKLAWDGAAAKPALLGSHRIGDVEYKTGFQILADSVAEWTPEKAAEVTWVSADKIRQAALLYGQNSPGACFARGQKVEFSINTSGIAHAFTIMMAIAGNFDVPGGQNIAREPANGADPLLFDLVPPKGEVRQRTMANLEKHSVCPGTQKILGELGGFGAATTHAMVTGKPFQPRMYWGQTSEPIVGVEDSREVLEGFKKLDFIVNVDLFMTPTGEMADIVLPAAHPNEVDRIEYAHSGHGWPASHTTLIRQPFSPPLGESRDDIDICFDLAARLGVNMGWKDKYAFYDFMMRPVGMTFENLREKVFIVRQPSYRRFETGGLRRDRKPGFETPTGKFNLYSEDLKRCGWGPLPTYIEPPISPYSKPELLAEYPYILITGGRSHAYFHTEYRQSPWMRELHTFPTVDINPETAAELHIEDGDWVYIETPHGRCKQRARLTLAIHPRVIHLEHDWWFPEKPVSDDLHGAFECNPNVLVANDGPYDPAIGTDQYGGLCKAYKALDGPPSGIWTTPEQLKGFLPDGRGAKHP